MEQLSATILVPLNRIKPNEDNPRYITADKFNKLAASIARRPKHLRKRPIICTTAPDGKYIPLGGNMRYRAFPEAIKLLEQQNDSDSARSLEILREGVPIILADDWTEEEKREFIVQDNLGYGEWDWDILSNNYDHAELADWGLTIPDFTVPEETTEDSFDTTPQEKANTVHGDIYELNGHRLVCGDSTSLLVINELMGEDRANLCFTSPPYWVGKDYETQKTEEEIDEFIQQIADGIVCALSPGGRIVINTGTSSINRIDKKRRVEILPLIDKWQRSLRTYGWLLRHLRIWAKRGQLPASISPKTDTIDQHNEYLGLFELNDEYSQVTTYWNPEGEQRGQERIKTPWAQQGLWDDIHGEKSAGGRHNAAFPVELPARNIRLYSKQGEIIYEPFGGSGTTMIAAEQLNRRARLIELSPNYCDVIVKRWTAWMMQQNKPYSIIRNGKIVTNESWITEPTNATGT
jgi:DNA modification methylase